MVAFTRSIVVLPLFLVLLSSTSFSEEVQSVSPSSQAELSASGAGPISQIDIQSVSSAVELTKLQKQLENVIQANQRLQEDYVRRMRKIKAISTQAKIHQRILDKIRVQQPINSPGIESSMRQQKLNLISQQAQRNQELLQSLRESKQNPS